jgi:hypothetical protein
MTDIPLTLEEHSPYRLIVEGRALTPGEVGEEALSLGALADPAIRERVQRAGIILGWDRRTRRLIVFFGEELWGEFLRRHEAEWTPPFIMAFAFDSSGDELEYLVAAIKVLKGSCCYR